MTMPSRSVIRDQEEAGLDIVTDGNMWYDEYVGVIGSFCWYLYERIPGFEPSRNPHPSMIGQGPSAGKTFLDDWGGVINNGPVDKPRRTAALAGPVSDRQQARARTGQGVDRRGPIQPRLARLFQ
jgi:methionine synthase II (cobalamin-independent)